MGSDGCAASTSSVADDATGSTIHSESTVLRSPPAVSMGSTRYSPDVPPPVSVQDAMWGSSTDARRPPVELVSKA